MEPLDIVCFGIFTVSCAFCVYAPLLLRVDEEDAVVAIATPVTSENCANNAVVVPGVPIVMTR